MFARARALISESKRCFNVKSSAYYFHVKTKISADFQICVSVPLRILTGKKHRQIKLQRLQKLQIWIFGLLVQQINSL